MKPGAHWTIAGAFSLSLLCPPRQLPGRLLMTNRSFSPLVVFGLDVPKFVPLLGITR